MTYDPQIAVYTRSNPGEYARIARHVALCERHHRRPCIAPECDVDGACPRHERTSDVAARYLRMFGGGS